MPMRHENRLAEGGFRFLLKEGTIYDNARYQHANTEAIVGHVILATGAFPSTSGMAANVWLDRTLAELFKYVDE